ncbi:MAG: YukJ family protein [Chloroflexi bacterium]|nr:YukJ family protein [Chloroflexota bacterium]
MKIRQYCVLTGRVIDRQRETWGKSPHYQILLDAGGQRFRIAVNTRSGTSENRVSELLYFADDDFRHEIIERLAGVADGDRVIQSRPGGLALDYQRGGMFDRREMQRIPSSRRGPRNDLVDELDFRVDRLMANATSRLHAYGTRWGPEPRTPDQVFGFTPGNGIHDVHMNQGNRDEHREDNSVWADGGLIFHEPGQKRWSAIFLAFQTQSWQTDENGNPLQYPQRKGGVEG